MKKIFILSLALVLILSGLGPSYGKVSAIGIYEEAGNLLKDLGVLTGNQYGDLGLEKNLKRQDMVVLVSRLYNEEDRAKVFNDPNTPNKFKDLDKFYTPYIRWAVSKNLIKGKSADTFGFNDEVTVQQFQAVLLRALGYNDESNDWAKVPDWANKLNLMTDLSLNKDAKLTRGQMAVMTLNTLNQETKRGLITLAETLGITVPQAFKVDATAKVENNTLIFEGQASGADQLFLHLKPASSSITTGEKVYNISLDSEGKFSYKVEDLQVGNYQYRFQGGTKYTDFQVVTINVLPFALVDVNALNLKEITLTFTQPVDKTTTSMVSNYFTTAGSIKDIRFEEKDTKIVISLNGNMTQRMKYKISAAKIKSAKGEEIQLRDHEFEALDNQIPTVLSVKQLGTKGLKLYLSEPVKNALPTHFKVDGKNFSGNAKLEYNTVTLSYFSSAYALSEGHHTLTITGLEDFAGLKATGETISFEISKDTTPPAIVSATATLEEVVIEFDEDLDPTLSNRTTYFYWKHGSLKRNSNKVTIEGNKAIVEFLTHKLSTAENTIYVENVVDYSNNKMKLSEVKVLPVIDTSSPEVVNYIVSEDGKTITVYYSKNVVGNLRTNYSIIDQYNKTVSIRDIQGSGKEFKINLYGSLPVGLNTFTIKDVQDTTPLKNPMVYPFTTTIDMKDVEKPRLVNHSGYANNIILYFSKPMDMGTVSNPNNYVMTYGGKQSYIPNNTIFTPSNDGKSVTMQLPEYDFDGKRIMIGTAGNLTALDIRGLKDISGNDTDPLIINITFDGSSSGKAKAVNYYSDKPGKQGVLLESNLIKVRFNIPIVIANPSDFVISGRTIYSVIADGTDELTIYLDDSDMTYLPTNSISIIPNNNMRTSIDTGVESGTIQLLDEVAPRVKDNISYLSVSGNMIELPFSETLEEVSAILFRRDLEIVRLADNKTLSEDDYSTTLKSTDKSVVIITINRRELTSSYSVKLGKSSSEALSYVRDKDGNLALPSEIYFTATDIPKQ